MNASEFQFPQPLPRATALSHALLRGRINEGDVVIDGTAGNGHDTVFLADLVGNTGSVIAFDIQAEAIESTRARCEAHGVLDQTALIRDSHATLSTVLDQRGISEISTAIFNLGYLPGSDKTSVTKSDSTITALTACVERLKKNGMVVIVCYPGHEEGASEAKAVEIWAETLDDKSFVAISHRALNSAKAPPFVIAVERRG